MGRLLVKPNPKTLHKYEVVQSARKRIVETDKALDWAKSSLNIAKAKSQSWEELFSSPVMQEFALEVQKEMARSLAKELSEKTMGVLKDRPILMDNLFKQGLEETFNKTGNLIADLLAHKIISEAKVYTDARRDSFIDKSTDAYVKILIPPMSFTIANRFPGEY